jgi:hypothetical protein
MIGHDDLLMKTGRQVIGANHPQGYGCAPHRQAGRPERDGTHRRCGGERFRHAHVAMSLDFGTDILESEQFQGNGSLDKDKKPDYTCSIKLSA